jgi:hypothetical protein
MQYYGSLRLRFRNKLHSALKRKDFIPSSGPEINPALDVVKPSGSADAKDQLSESLASIDVPFVVHLLLQG